MAVHWFHPHTNTDNKIQVVSPSAVSIVGDISITHLFLGKGSSSAECAGVKNSLYRLLHAEHNMLFVPTDWHPQKQNVAS